MENQNRTRSHQILFRVSDEEYKIIRRKMIMSRMRNREAFIRKMLIEGVIINVDTAPLEDIFYEMHKIGTNVNQIAKVANTNDTISQDELKELKERDISLAKQIVDLENKKSDLEQRLLEDENREKLALRLMERTLWVLAREEAIENEEKIRTFEQRLNDHQKKLFQKTFQGLPISRTMKVDADLIRVAVDLFFGYIESANRFLAEKGLPTYKPSEDSVRQEGESDDDWRSRCWRTALRLMNPTIEV